MEPETSTLKPQTLNPNPGTHRLNFVVVGGGPTGVEFAAELADLLHEDLKHSFPKMKDDVKIQVSVPSCAT